MPAKPSPSPLLFLLPLIWLLLAACNPSPAATSPPLATSSPRPSPTFAPSPTSTLASPLHVSPTPLPSATLTPAAPLPQACSPLQDVPGPDLPGRVVNPFNPPRLGSDDPHQGVDLAQRLDGDAIALAGWPVQAVLPGTVAGLISDRFPYGNAVLVETPLLDVPTRFLEGLRPAELDPGRATPVALTCPEGLESAEMAAADQERSLYILYAHLQDRSALQPGQEVGCGQALGAIGDSGNALNPHLHIELRLGPANSRFLSMAHYDPSAEPEEMANYCLWRVSGLFQLLDPMPLLALVE